ncbi:hypothetical protein EPD60_16080 [Flaviaesturariibacter flavus]|uniref:DUF4252 domain-containing protein n=1 Tax=Flaviaesturariibacter flavus TaxID=2502780 RepID=A0A4R1B212_9BACT|nr:hypothetical protein [Flaviaesturariibacter flavus]TCJ12074.1 hypothetical protein EPD60_16080 [Flaviaesturariibacter flavus]
MKSLSKLALLALALYTTGAVQAQGTARKAAPQAAAAPVKSPVKNYYVVQLWNPSEPPTAQDEASLNAIRAAYKGKKVEVFSMRWSSEPELRGILGKFFGKNVQVDAGNEHSFVLNGVPFDMHSLKATLLIGDDKLLVSNVGKSDESISNYLKTAVK